MNSRNNTSSNTQFNRNSSGRGQGSYQGNRYNNGNSNNVHFNTIAANSTSHRVSILDITPNIPYKERTELSYKETTSEMLAHLILGDTTKETKEKIALSIHQLQQRFGKDPDGREFIMTPPHMSNDALSFVAIRIAKVGKEEWMLEEERLKSTIHEITYQGTRQSLKPAVIQDGRLSDLYAALLEIVQLDDGAFDAAISSLVAAKYNLAGGLTPAQKLSGRIQNTEEKQQKIGERHWMKEGEGNQERK
jgi:hypothetical protein